MDNTELIWREEGRKEVFRCRVFSVRETYCRSPDNQVKTFSVMDAPDWAIVIPVVETEQGRAFAMVRQWRHGAGELSLEFPGGVLEHGEEPAAAASRELLEETAFRAGKITPLGAFNPNPAIMANHVHFFLAENLEDIGKQNLDEDEYVHMELVPENEVLQGMGRPPYIHALMGTALALYQNFVTNHKS
jgi:8-oxo-dGTP pyrophosphatase MutT (NUDIX family)